MKRNFLATVTLLLLSASAWAGTIVSMPIGPGGQVIYGKGGRTDLWGSGITITGLIDGGKSLNLSWGRLFFTTGRGEGWKGNTLEFAPGGSFAVRGCIGCGHKGDIVGVLMSGTFLNVELVKEGNETILIAKFLEHLNPALAALMKLPTQSIGEFEMVLGPDGNTKSCVFDNVDGGSIGILPEPSSIALLATSLLGLLFILRTGTRPRQYALPAPEPGT